MGKPAFAVITISRADINQHITSPDILLDKKGRLSISDIEHAPYANSFAQWNTDQLILPAQTTVWMRLSLRNITDKTTHLSLRSSLNEVDSFEFYLSSSKGTYQEPTQVIPQETAFARLKQLPISINAGQTRTVYIRVYSTHNPQVNIYLESQKTAQLTTQNMFIKAGAFIGVNLLLILYCLAQAQQKQGFFKQLSVLSGLLLLLQMTWLGFPAELWNVIPVPRYLIHHVTLLLGYICALQLARRMLETPKGTLAIDLIISLMMAVNLALVLIIVPLPTLLSDFQLQALASINTALLTLAGVVRLYDGHRTAGHWLMVFIPFTIIQVTLSLSSTSILPFNLLIVESLLLFASLGVIFGLTLWDSAPSITKDEPISAEEPQASPTPTVDWSHFGHDLRTPMNGILGMTELMAATKLSNRQQDYLHTIQLSGQELLTLINQLVDVSKINNGEIAIASETFELDDLLHNCIERYSYKSDQLGLDLACWIDEGVPAFLKGDTARINRILNSLMSHALNHTEQGELLLTATLSPNSTTNPEPTQPPLFIRFMVQSSDRGAGFTSASRSLRSNVHDNNYETSSGITLARDVIRHLKGNAGASRSEQGTHYWFNIPLEVAERPFEPPKDKMDLTNYRALVVDDNDTCRNILVQQIQKLGLQVEQARDATEAMALLRTESNVGRPFDITFLDHQMPGISGMQLARRIADTPELKDLKIVMLTGLSQLPNSALLTHTAIKKLLTKPVNGKLLKKTIEEQFAANGRDNTASADITPAEAESS